MTDFEKLAEWVNREMDRPDVNQKALLTSLVNIVKSKVKDAMADYEFFVDREIRFGKFLRSWRKLGECDIRNNDSATINVSKNIIFARNGDTITNNVFHEMLHAVLPMEECHGKRFDFGSAELNRRYGCHIEHCSSNARVRVPKMRYQIICPKCNVVLKTIPRDEGLGFGLCGGIIKHPELFSCSKCKSKITLKPITVELVVRNSHVVERLEIHSA